MEFENRYVQVPINGALPGEKIEYMEVATEQNTVLAQENFSIDDTTLREEYENARKQHIPVKPDYIEYMSTAISKYEDLIPALRKPLDKTRTVIKSFSADGVYKFHYPSSDKWKDKLVTFDPINQIIKTIPLPDGH